MVKWYLITLADLVLSAWCIARVNLFLGILLTMIALVIMIYKLGFADPEK